LDPCKEAAALSLKCLDRNNYDKSKCADYFHSYRNCKEDFFRERRRRKREERYDKEEGSVNSNT
jgi:cytochrome c oxidase assembly protein subunit 23